MIPTTYHECAVLINSWQMHEGPYHVGHVSIWPAWMGSCVRVRYITKKTSIIRYRIHLLEIIVPFNWGLDVTNFIFPTVFYSGKRVTFVGRCERAPLLLCRLLAKPYQGFTPHGLPQGPPLDRVSPAFTRAHHSDRNGLWIARYYSWAVWWSF